VLRTGFGITLLKVRKVSADEIFTIIAESTESALNFY
jgi:hypothetical protein